MSGEQMSILCLARICIQIIHVAIVALMIWIGLVLMFLFYVLYHETSHGRPQEVQEIQEERKILTGFASNLCQQAPW